MCLCMYHRNWFRDLTVGQKTSAFFLFMRVFLLEQLPIHMNVEFFEFWVWNGLNWLSNFILDPDPNPNSNYYEFKK